MSIYRKSSDRHYKVELIGAGEQVPVDAQQQRQRPTRWWFQSRTLILFACFLLRIGGAVGHHFWFLHLDGKRAEDQAWVIRGGTVIAFAVKILFSASIGVGFTQNVWRKLRKRMNSLGAMDSLFTLRDNPFSFSSGEVLTRANLCAVIATLSWALALVPIMVPASISVRPDDHNELLDSLPILTLNFSKPAIETRYINEAPAAAVQLGKHRANGATLEAYVNPSGAATGLIYITLYGKQILEAPSSCGANFSFNQGSIGLAYKCEDIDLTTTTVTANPFSPSITPSSLPPSLRRQRQA